jgi:aminomethyltransferase
MFRTPLHDSHATHGARMVDFHGWEMPVSYRSIQEEVLRVRRGAGVFDLSHMGRVFVRGPDRVALLEHVTSAPVARLEPGRIRYAILPTEEGGVIDDILVYADRDEILLVVNAGNRLRDLEWIRGHATGLRVDIDDRTEALAMIAIQGPEAVERLSPLCAAKVSDLGYYRFRRERVSGVEVLLSRTGYTGEDGFEIVADAARAGGLWRELLASGGDGAVWPIGLGARDTLRLEAGMPLYGHELSDQTNPLEAGLEWAVRKESHFIGDEAIARVASRGVARRLMGLVVDSKRIPRQGALVTKDGVPAGVVTSGTASPTLQRTIAMAYVDGKHAVPGTSVHAAIREDLAPSEVVDLPFYSRTRRRGRFEPLPA